MWPKQLGVQDGNAVSAVVGFGKYGTIILCGHPCLIGSQR